MAPRLRLMTRARQQCEFALLLYLDAKQTNGINETEFALIGGAIEDAVAITRAADAAEALGQAMSRGIESDYRLQQLVSGMQRVLDELPDAAA